MPTNLTAPHLLAAQTGASQSLPKNSCCLSHRKSESLKSLPDNLAQINLKITCGLTVLFTQSQPSQGWGVFVWFMGQSFAETLNVSTSFSRDYAEFPAGFLIPAKALFACHNSLQKTKSLCLLKGCYMGLSSSSQGVWFPQWAEGIEHRTLRRQSTFAWLWWTGLCRAGIQLSTFNSDKLR